MPDSENPTIVWLRRDLRLSDNPALVRAAARGGPVIPVFILDSLIEDEYGAAPLWRLGLSLADLGRRLAERGSRLILRRGEAKAVLEALIEETGAGGVVWSRLYDSRSVDRDRKIKAALGERVEIESVNASLLFEPWTVETNSGGFYKVYTPFWRAVRGRNVDEPLASPGELPAPARWPASASLDEWALGNAMNRGADVVARYVSVGEEAAHGRLGSFAAHGIGDYAKNRDHPDIDGTSGLSEHLTYGEISPRQCWHAGRRALERASGKGATKGPVTFLQELVWREFAYHLLWHTPQITDRNWRDKWDDFPWRRDNNDAERWRRGMTGEPMVDAAMRQLYTTGYMHNRCRMLVASYLCKHLMTDWRVGERWFRECLADWDIANNALGWQWSAGSGPDATPFFRVFNPETQGEKYDPDGTYRDRFIAEGRDDPHETALAFFQAVPHSWGLDPDQDYPERIIGLKEGRERALAAYENRPDAA